MEVEKEISKVPKSEESPNMSGSTCALCGCSTPAVRCDRCSSQIFCLSCDDMYHRHPKRKLHLRKAVDSIWNSTRSPRLRKRTELPGDPSKIPIPPPRSKRRERHNIGGRMFFKSGLELGSFGHSKVFDLKNITPPPKDFFQRRRSHPEPSSTNVGEGLSAQTPNQSRPGSAQIYENDNIVNQENVATANEMERGPWNTSRPNISSPIQVSIPSSSPDMLINGQSFGFPSKPQSQSAADLTGPSSNAAGHHPYPFPHPYPYMHPQMHPPYSHSLAHLNCAQCISSSWSNLMSPHPSPFFHPMPWGSAHATLAKNQQGVNGHIKHSHGDLINYPDSNFHYPYPGGSFYHNAPPAVDPNFMKELHQQVEANKMKKSPAGSRHSNEEMNAETAMDFESNTEAASVSANAATSNVTEATQNADDVPKIPDKPTEPWSCVHCTFINPPGDYICQVCCKTSYGTTSISVEDQSELTTDIRDNESPLFNRDALMNSPQFSDYKEAQKVI